MTDGNRKSLYERPFGKRSLLGFLVGSIIAAVLVLILYYIVAQKEKYENPTGLLNVVFVVIGY